MQTGSGARNEISVHTQISGLVLDSTNSGVNDAAAQAAKQSQITNALSTTTDLSDTTNLGGNETLTFNGGSADPVSVYLDTGVNDPLPEGLSVTRILVR